MKGENVCVTHKRNFEHPYRVDKGKRCQNIHPYAYVSNCYEVADGHSCKAHLAKEQCKRRKYSERYDVIGKYGARKLVAISLCDCVNKSIEESSQK